MTYTTESYEQAALRAERKPPAHSLQDLRKRDGLTQAEAAKLLGFADYNGVGRIESGLRSPSPQAWRLLCLWQRYGLDALRAVQP